MSHYDATFKILIMGDGTSDKTNIVKRFCYNIYNPSERLTIGVDFNIKTMELDGKKFKLQMWDVGGEESFRFLLPTYCLGAHGGILLYDITNRRGLDHVLNWVSIIRQKTRRIPIVLAGTNADLEQHR